MDFVLKISKLLPNKSDIQNISAHNSEAAYILLKAIDSVSKLMSKTSNADEIAEEAFFLIESLVDKCWEQLNTGHFSTVPLNLRKIYAISNYFRVTNHIL